MFFLFSSSTSKNSPQGGPNVSKSDKAKTLLQLIDRKKFDSLCEKWGMDKGALIFFTWQQTGVLVMSYFLRLESSRDIEEVLGIPRSTFCDANQNRSAGFFEELCEMILGELRGRCRNRKIKRALGQLLAIDSTECRIHGSISSYLPSFHGGRRSPNRGQ